MPNKTAEYGVIFLDANIPSEWKYATSLLVKDLEQGFKIISATGANGVIVYVLERKL